MRTLATLLVTCALACAPGGAGLRGSPPGAVDFSLARQGGGTYRLSEDRGRVVLVDVWATWCAPCRKTLPIVETVARRFEAEGVRAYAVSVDANVDQVPEFVKETKLGLPVLLDAEADVVENVLRVREMPTTLVIDGQGRVRYRHEGAGKDLQALLEQELDQLLHEGDRS